MLKELKEKVWNANLELVRKGVVIYTWGNVSEIDRNNGLVVIKPSGIGYDDMKPEDMVVLDLENGKKVDGKWNPSSDTETHLELYRAFSEIGGITHTHSINAAVFAQAGLSIPALGTTHADYFYGDIPCTRALVKEEIEAAYEKNTGKVIVETIRKAGYEPFMIPGILVKNHGPFTWGKNADESVYHAVVMEHVAEMAMKTMLLNEKAVMSQDILDKHYMRKHGKDAYYGQGNL
uniref:L-ribulose-5-phosphate 4-epimerase n=1 Tax=Agathobacter sp. TaxID=2021311 RepID=UPI004056F026